MATRNFIKVRGVNDTFRRCLAIVSEVRYAFA